MDEHADKKSTPLGTFIHLLKDLIQGVDTIIIPNFIEKHADTGNIYLLLNFIFLYINQPLFLDKQYVTVKTPTSK
jgi:hypothetical protein